MVTGDAVDAPPGVRSGVRLVQPADGRTVVRVSDRRTHVEQLVRRQLTVEDVPTDQPELVLHLPWPDDLAVKDGAFEVRRHLVHQVDDAVRVLLEFVLVALLSPLVRNPLGEHRDDVFAFRRKGLVEYRRDGDVRERHLGALAAARIDERLLDVVDRRRQLDGSSMDVDVVPGSGRELGQLRDRHVDLDGSRTRLVVVDVAHEVRRQFVPVQMLLERDLWVDGGDDQRRVELLAALDHHPGRRAVTGQDLGHAGTGAHLRPEELRRTPARLRDGAHAALGEAPGSELPVSDVADGVVCHDVGGSRLEGAGPRSDDAGNPAGDNLGHGGLEPLVEQILDGHREELREVGDHALADAAAVLPTEATCRQQVLPTLRADVWRRLHEQRSHDVGDTGDPILEREVVLGVPLRELRDGLGLLLLVTGESERSAVELRDEVRTLRQDLVPEALELQIADDARRNE